MIKPAPFSARLKALRLAAGLSIPDLALRVDLTPQALHLLENGERQPTWATVMKLAEALDVTTDAFRP